MRWSLPTIQSLTAGYADTGGFLALKGLFTSHVTGNFVTLGAALVFGTAARWRRPSPCRCSVSRCSSAGCSPSA